MQVLAIGFQLPTGLDFVGLAYQGKDIVFRFIIEYIVSLRDFGPSVINNRSNFYTRIFESDILGCVET
jgi:hypothetical protein